MAVTYTRNMPDSATYWGPGTPDGLGGFTWPAPVLITCRWEQKRELFRNDQGDDTVSAAVVFPDRDLAVGGYLAEGDHTSSPAPTDAPSYQIRQRGANKNLSGSRVLYQVWLG